MENIRVLVTIPELEGQQAFLDEMAAVSPRLVIEQRTSTTWEQTATMVTDVEVLYTNRAPSHLEHANRLRWVQLHTSGFDRSAQAVFAPGTIAVTNVAGAHAVPMAEYCLTVMVMLARGFLQLVRDQGAKERNPAHSPPVELAGRTVGIVGYGQTGREVARLATAHGMRVLALKRHPEQRRATGYQWPGVGDPEGALPERFFGPDELHDLLGESDYVLDSLPLTDETRGVFDAAAFRAMRPSAYFMNVGSWRDGGRRGAGHGAARGRDRWGGARRVCHGPGAAAAGASLLGAGQPLHVPAHLRQPPATAVPAADECAVLREPASLRVGPAAAERGLGRAGLLRLSAALPTCERVTVNAAPQSS